MGHSHNHDDHEHYYDDSKLHDNQYVFLRHYAHMLETLDEGIGYILTRVKNEHTFDMPIFEDVIESLITIQNANTLASNLMMKIDGNAYNTILSFEELKPDFEEVKEYLEVNDMDKVINILMDSLLLKYLSWSKNVNNALIQYIQQ